jgi:hypothetical protein
MEWILINEAQEPYLMYILRLSSTDCMQNATGKSTIISDPGHVIVAVSTGQWAPV